MYDVLDRGRPVVKAPATSPGVRATQRQILDANHRHRYLRHAEEIDAAKSDEARFVVEMSRLMDRLRAVEGQLMQMRQRGQRRLQ